MRRSQWCCVWGMGLALLAGGSLATCAYAQGTVKGAPGIQNGPVGTPKGRTAKPRVPEKRITFSMAKKPWQGENGVLKWLSNQLGIPLVGKEFPSGSFNFTPPVVNGVVQTYTLSEVLDLINQQLQREKWVLIRYGDHFTVVPSDKELPEFPRIELDELAQRAESEVVSVVYPLKKLSVVEFAPEVQKILMQPFGKVVILESSNRLILQDTVKSLKGITEMIRTIEGGSDTGRNSILHHKCQYHLASEAAEHLKNLLGDEKEEVVTISPKGEKKVQHRIHKISVDDSSNTVLVTGPADKIAKAREILQIFDKGIEKVAVGKPFLKFYPVAGGNAEAISKLLQESYKSSANLKVSAVGSTTIGVWATPEMQFRIAKEIMPAKEDNALTSKAEFIPLTVSEAEKMATFLQNAFPTDYGKTGGPVIDADVGRNGILVYGTEAQVQEVRKTIAAIEGSQEGSAAGASGMRIFNLDKGGSAADLAEALKAVIKGMRPDADVKLILPGRAPTRPEPVKKSAPDKKPEQLKQIQKRVQASYPISTEEPRQAGKDTAPQQAKQKRTAINITAAGNKLIVTSTDPSALKLVQELVNLYTNAPGGGQFEIIHLKYASAIDVARILDEAFNGPKQPNAPGNPNPGNPAPGGPGPTARGPTGPNGAPAPGGPGTGAPSPGGSSGRGFRNGMWPMFPGGRTRPGQGREDRIRVVADPSINALLVKASPLDMLTIRSLLKRALDTNETDSEAVVKSWSIGPLKYANAAEVALVAERVYQDKINQNPRFRRSIFGQAQNNNVDYKGENRPVTLQIGVDERTNTLFLSAPEALYKDVKKLAENMERAAEKSPPTVHIVPVKSVDPDLVTQAILAIQGVGPTMQNGQGGRPGFGGLGGRPGGLRPFGGVGITPGGNFSVFGAGGFGGRGGFGGLPGSFGSPPGSVGFGGVRPVGMGGGFRNR